MTAGTFQNNSLDWQVQKLGQRLSEGLERLLGGDRDHPLDSQSVPEWLLRGLFGLLVIGATAWAAWQLYRLLRPYWAYGQDTGAPLVAAAELPSSEWLQHAQRAHAQGNDRDACRALYMAALQRLSERQLIPLEVSRTDGEYLALLQSLNLSSPYQILIQTHERLWFDRVSASPALYDRCWRAYQEIERA